LLESIVNPPWLVTDSGRFLQLLDQDQARDLLRLTDPQSHGGGPRAVI
jgi:hypothetical protein